MARRLLAHADRPLLAVLLALCLLGLYNLGSAEQALGANLQAAQASYMALGLVLMAVVASIDYRNYEGLAFPIFFAVLALLIATAMFGKTVNGSKRWLTILPGLPNLQTSDLAKVAIILVVAKLFHLEGGEGGRLSLDRVFRPLNVSRPLLLVGIVLAITVGGDRVRPFALKEQVGRRHRTIAKLAPENGRLLIGRGASADVRLSFPGVEPQHAEIVRLDDGVYVLRDLGSAAGVYVNHERVLGERPLRDGDLIRVGLAAQGELMASAFITKVRPLLPAVAVLAALWLFLAIFLQFRRGRLSSTDILAPIDWILMPAVLILMQPDLGTATITVAIAFTIILYVGLRPSSLLALAVGGVVFGAVAWAAVLKPYQKERVTTFLNPDSDPLGAGYHQTQSMIAIGSGQLFGKGHGQGTQSQLRFLPEQQTDFIFSLWAEEHGLVGCLLVVALFVALVLLSLRLATRAKDRFGALLVVGASALIFWHALVNMLMVIRLAPVVGVPLPLFSYGGSFVITTFMAIGLILNVGMRRFVF